MFQWERNTNVYSSLCRLNNSENSIFFKVIEHALRQAQKLKNYVIVATPGSYSRKRLERETEKNVVKFYERDVSR